jgi:hypothetical protein
MERLSSLEVPDALADAACSEMQKMSGGARRVSKRILNAEDVRRSTTRQQVHFDCIQLRANRMHAEMQRV